MKKYIISVLVVAVVFLSYQTLHGIFSGQTAVEPSNLGASATTPLSVAKLITTPTKDLTPRISYWSGKVNQHVDIATSTWQTDPDGSSGSSIDKLVYCKKFYPYTTSVVAYKTETINSWYGSGNKNNYASSQMSYSCVQKASTPSITVLSPNGGETYVAGQQITVKWKSTNIPANTQLTIGLSMSVSSGAHTTSTPIIQNTPNDGSESFILNNTILDYFGKTDGYPFKIYISSGGPAGVLDYSDNSFTINRNTATPVACTLNSPTLVTSSSTSGQYVATGDTGVTDATKATYKFSNSGCGTDTISELKFSATNATSVKVNGISAPVTNGVAYVTGLNLAVPNGGSGLNVDAYVSYPNVGITGVPSGSTSQIALTYVKYVSNNIATSTTLTSPVSAPTMMLVSSKPIITVSQPNSVLNVGSGTEAIDVNVTADVRGDIKLNSLFIKFSTSNVKLVGGTSSPIIVKDSNGTILNTTNLPLPTISGDSIINFTNGYKIAAGASQTFKIYIPIASVSGTGSSSAYLYTTLGNVSNLSWSDNTGKVMTGSNNTTYFYNYPTTTSEIHN
ncbi:MAG TPA: Ser-Thr-rich GPI-anchored membrane family protein [Candidatus Paceibacterota bacterium]|nr:Ser-Thr-rich GPI-anchored membrane family protein [Candidatus Paceibacterota bacterium]